MQCLQRHAFIFRLHAGYHPQLHNGTPVLSCLFARDTVKAIMVLDEQPHHCLFDSAGTSASSPSDRPSTVTGRTHTFRYLSRFFQSPEATIPLRLKEKVSIERVIDDQNVSDTHMRYKVSRSSYSSTGSDGGMKVLYAVKCSRSSWLPGRLPSKHTSTAHDTLRKLSTIHGGSGYTYAHCVHRHRHRQTGPAFHYPYQP